MISIFLIYFFSSPNLSGRRLDVYHTSTHGLALVRRMHLWNVLHAARWKYRTQKIAILAPSDNFIGLYLRSWGMYRQSEKNLLNNEFSQCSQYLSQSPCSSNCQSTSWTHLCIPHGGQITAREVPWRTRSFHSSLFITRLIPPSFLSSPHKAAPLWRFGLMIPGISVKLLYVKPAVSI